jgi:hypothetical protein
VSTGICTLCRQAGYRAADAMKKGLIILRRSVRTAYERDQHGPGRARGGSAFPADGLCAAGQECPISPCPDPWQAGAVADTLDSLVDSWLTLSQAADLLGVSVTKVRQLVREHQLVAVRRDDLREPGVPAECILNGAIVKGLSGTLILLSDHGFDAAESIEWLFTSDDSLPGRPIDALREDRGTEVRRRAQAVV